MILSRPVAGSTQGDLRVIHRLGAAGFGAKRASGSADAAAHYRDIANGRAATDEYEREFESSARALGRTRGTLPTPWSAAG
jgi:hypothetical protein